MEHSEVKIILSDARAAVLFVHGIVGTPRHFDLLMPLVSPSFSVWNLLLDGHGNGVKDFSKTSMKRWEAQVSAAVEELSRTHDKIVVVAHSMGTLLAIEQALKNDKIVGLFLLASPMKVAVKRRMLVSSRKIYLGRALDEHALAVKRACGVSIGKNLFSYLGWVPRFLELFAKIRQIRKRIPDLRTPCRVYQSAEDELVSAKSVRYLQNPCMTVHVLASSGHFSYGEADRAFLQAEFSEMLRTVTP